MCSACFYNRPLFESRTFPLLRGRDLPTNRSQRSPPSRLSRMTSLQTTSRVRPRQQAPNTGALLLSSFHTSSPSPGCRVFGDSRRSADIRHMQVFASSRSPEVVQNRTLGHNKLP
ncbi:hypothetical protein AGIG_G3334 [Arapaima gigas]